MSRPHVRNIVRALALAVLAVAVLAIVGDVRALVGRMQTFDVRVFVLALVLSTANYGFRFLRWQYYLDRIDVKVPWVDSLRVFVAGFVMSISPGKVGEVLKSALLYEQHGVDPARTAPIVLAERITDLLALVLLLTLGSVYLPSGLPVAALGAVVVLGVWSVCASRRIGGFVIDRLGRWPRLARLAPRLRDAHTALRTVVGPGPLVAATLLATFAWGLECLSLKLLVEGFAGAHIGLLEATFAYSAPTILGALALLPGGLVVTEASMTGTLETVGGASITPAIASGATILVRLATLWWAVLLGFFALALHRRGMAKAQASVLADDSPAEGLPARR